MYENMIHPINNFECARVEPIRTFVHVYCVMYAKKLNAHKETQVSLPLHQLNNIVHTYVISHHFTNLVIKDYAVDRSLLMHIFSIDLLNLQYYVINLYLL